ncbi:hypothetical protein EVAR_80024_1 [Eumeta japonica]|uniref:Uncharacterized protein n=1 Tax=Eumeta variegata TaxID=151549 RepID=A0A4C1WNP1_EUMVA|nr:hypothetical protein EVAR_80024_1 [Eumeta japonica]
MTELLEARPLWGYDRSELLGARTLRGYDRSELLGARTLQGYDRSELLGARPLRGYNRSELLELELFGGYDRLQCADTRAAGSARGRHGVTGPRLGQVQRCCEPQPFIVTAAPGAPRAAAGEVALTELDISARWTVSERERARAPEGDSNAQSHVTFLFSRTSRALEPAIIATRLRDVTALPNARGRNPRAPAASPRGAYDAAHVIFHGLPKGLYHALPNRGPRWRGRRPAATNGRSAFTAFRNPTSSSVLSSLHHVSGGTFRNALFRQRLLSCAIPWVPLPASILVSDFKILSPLTLSQLIGLIRLRK